MLISLLGGWAGIDRFYQRQIGWGILKMVTCGGAGIWYLVDAAIYAYIAGRDQEL
jgi:TM2 domain-containing membrane protein YozV